MDVRGDHPTMSIDEFCEWLAVRFQRPPGSVLPDASFSGDLGFDSINVLELVTDLEDAVGGDVVLPLELLLSVRTVRDAYLQYCALNQLPLDPGRGRP